MMRDRTYSKVVGIPIPSFMSSMSSAQDKSC